MRKILLVEDDQSQRILIKKILEYFEFDCDEAGDGFTAIDKVKEKDYAFIIMDIIMPKLDGLETIRRIRKYEEEKSMSSIPIVVLTAHPSEELKNECNKLKVTNFLTKPYNLGEIKKIIKNVVFSINEEVPANIN